MFGDHFAPARQLLAALQGIVGPTREVNDVQNATTRGQWEHRAEYKGRPLRFIISHSYRSAAVGRLVGVELWVPLGGRPVELSMDFPPLVPGQAPAPIPENAGSLFPHGLVSGVPLDVVRAAFDPSTTAIVNATIGPKGLRVTSEGDWLSVFVHVGEAQPFSSAPTWMPTAADLTRMLDFASLLAERLVSAFDQAHAAAMHAGGPAAAAQWLAAQRAAQHERREKRRTGNIIAVAVTVLIIFLIIAIVFAIVAFSGC